jgi:hypothetical protein
VAVSLGKKGFIENLKKNKFSGIWRIVWALGADGPWVVVFYLILEFLAKGFEKMRFPADGPRGPGGRSAGTRRTVRGDQADGPRGAADGPLFITERGAARWTGRTVRVAQADGPRGPGGRSAQPNGQSPQPLTSRFYRWNSNADSPRGHRGQSARHAFCS